jgi:hypothetical protein
MPVSNPKVEQYALAPTTCMPSIEAPRSKLRGIFDRKEVCYFQIRSLTLQQAAWNALAFAVQQ